MDDLSDFLVDASVTETERVRYLMGLILCCDCQVFVMGAADAGKGTFSATGTVTGYLRSSFRAGVSGFRGRSLDLKSAYMARHPDESWSTVLAVYNPEDDEVHFFEVATLPFERKSSVTGFNRVAWALKLIMSRLLYGS